MAEWACKTRLASKTPAALIVCFSWEEGGNAHLSRLSAPVGVALPWQCLALSAACRINHPLLWNGSLLLSFLVLYFLGVRESQDFDYFYGSSHFAAPNPTSLWATQVSGARWHMALDLILFPVWSMQVLAGCGWCGLLLSAAAWTSGWCQVTGGIWGLGWNMWFCRQPCEGNPDVLPNPSLLRCLPWLSHTLDLWASIVISVECSIVMLSFYLLQIWERTSSLLRLPQGPHQALSVVRSTGTDGESGFLIDKPRNEGIWMVLLH